MNVLIATPMYNAWAYTQYVHALITTVIALERMRIKFDVHLIPSDTYIWRARNFMANGFLEHDFTHLFFIDGDMAWPFESFLSVLNCKEDFVGANYPRKNQYDKWAALIDNYPVIKDGLVECNTVPTGFCKISRRVFETLVKRGELWKDDGIAKHDFFSHIKLADGTILGDDVSFCHRWREEGGKCFVLPDCKISHIGYEIFNGDFGEYLRSQKRISYASRTNRNRSTRWDGVCGGFYKFRNSQNAGL